MKASGAMIRGDRAGSIVSYKKKLSFGVFIYKYRILHIMALPCIIYYVMFHYVPMLGIIIAFKNYRGVVAGFAGIYQAPWIGFKNLEMFFSSMYFGRLMRNTIMISLCRIIFSFPTPIIFALLLNEIRGKVFKRAVQTISYLPHFLSWVVIAGLVTTLLSTDNGPINELIIALGGEPIFFLASNKWFRSVLVVSGIWQGVGWGSIVYLAAISGISPELYESAELDGATRYQKMWHITLPSIKEIIAIYLILSVGRILGENFDQIYNLYSPVVYEVADVFETFVYRSGVGEARFSYSAAVGLFKGVVSFALVLLTNRAAKLLGSDGIW